MVGQAGTPGSRTSPHISPRRSSAGGSALIDQIQFHQYVQFVFHRQWSGLKAYANEHGISIIGDVPIFVSYDSADAWAHPELFHFDAQGRPTLGRRSPARLL